MSEAWRPDWMEPRRERPAAEAASMAALVPRLRAAGLAVRCGAGEMLVSDGDERIGLVSGRPEHRADTLRVLRLLAKRELSMDPDFYQEDHDGAA